MGFVDRIAFAATAQVRGGVALALLDTCGVMTLIGLRDVRPDSRASATRVLMLMLISCVCLTMISMDMTGPIFETPPWRGARKNAQIFAIVKAFNTNSTGTEGASTVTPRYGC